MSKQRKYKRAPNGYRIEQWADGSYHVYGPDGGCIDEPLTRKEAVELAIKDKQERAAKPKASEVPHA